MLQCNLSTEKLDFITYKGILDSHQEEDTQTGRSLPPDGQNAPSFFFLLAVITGITYASAKAERS